MNRNKNFIQMLISRIIGNKQEIRYLTKYNSMPIVKISSFFILKYVICAPNFISFLLVDMIDLI